MRFTIKSITAFATAAALSNAPVNAFSVGGKTQSRLNPFGLQGLASAEAHKAAPARSSMALSASPTDVDEEVQRLKSMAAKLRQETSQLEAEQAKERAQTIKKAFDKFDTNHDGELSLDELKAALEKTFKLDLPEDKVERLIADFDKSGDGAIQLDEFVSIDQFRNRLDAMERGERQKELDASKAVQQEEEVSKLIESQLELINDREPTGTDRIVSVLPYLFPLMDGLLFGQYLLAGNESNPLVGVLALLYTAYRSVPFGGFLAFFALNAFSGNLSINRLVRFNMQQAIYLDIALFVPGLIATLTSAASSGLGVSIPPMVGELSSDAIFVTLIAVLGYSTVSSLLGVTPDKVPFLSQRVNERVPTVDQLELLDPRTGEPLFKNRGEDKNTEDDNKKN